LTLVGEQQIDPRLWDLAFTTPALSGQTHVRVLLPAGYDGSSQRYPVLYLLHGSGADYRQWTSSGYDAESLTANLPLIVVMPDGGSNGEYTDWVNPPAGAGPQQWERFHVEQLVRWIDGNFRTLADRGHRAISGESMGGLGTMEYAARFPDVFGVAASLSGAVSLDSWVGWSGVALNETVFGTEPPDAIYGSLASDELNWRDHSPPDIAMNLAATRLWISAHNGLPSPTTPTEVDPVEMGVHEDSVELLAALQRLRIPVTWQDLGSGGHNAAGFDQQLGLALPWIMQAFAGPPPAPPRVSYASAQPTWSMWGWAVSMNRPAAEFSILRNASARGFELYGSGTGVVTTPPDFRPGGTYRITLVVSRRGEPGASHPEPGCANSVGDPRLETAACQPVAPPPPFATLRPLVNGAVLTETRQADAAGRLYIQVPLGQGNAVQEFARRNNASTLIYRTTVRIARLHSA